ncbi:hypothetical protein AVEN_35709-1 [Araneus ventricosus]|uniref:Uncharacterized protein n=1 Tax=Araneus ventricosus TaxID=182803 RepID=A0A4Y2HYT0_ARAVE|nr:hypothetical protein AVEN_35709-1 [Araneus ventricosus]
MEIVFVDSLTFLLLSFELQTTQISMTGKLVMSHCRQFSDMSSHELLKMIPDDAPMDGWDFIKFPSHTQAVERIVKLFTEVSRKRVGSQNRDGFIRAILESIK